MAIPIKTPGEIAKMRVSGRLAFSVLEEVVAGCRAGMTSREVGAAAKKAIEHTGATPLLLGFRSSTGVEFPAAACVSINEEVVHAIPSDRILREGDIVTVDLAIRDSANWCADCARSVVVKSDSTGPNTHGSSHRARNLAAASLNVLTAAINSAGPGVMWSAVAKSAADSAIAAGCHLADGYCGHGIGREMHEPPRLRFGNVPQSEDIRLMPGMVITIEPIVIEGTTPAELVTLDDGWTVVASNRAWAAHEERTVAITRSGVDVLTGPS